MELMFYRGKMDFHKMYGSPPRYFTRCSYTYNTVISRPHSFDMNDSSITIDDKMFYVLVS